MPDLAGSTSKWARAQAGAAQERGVPGRLDRLSRPVLAAATVMALAATGIMILEGFSRYVLNVSYFWAEESVRFLMIWAFFLTLGIAGLRRCHIRTELLVQRLPAALQRAAWLLSCLAGMAFAFILTYSSIPQVRRFYTMGMMSESSLDLPMWLLFLAMPVGGATLFLYYLYAAWHAWRRGDPFGTPLAEEEARAWASGAPPHEESRP